MITICVVGEKASFTGKGLAECVDKAREHFKYHSVREFAAVDGVLSVIFDRKKLGPRPTEQTLDLYTEQVTFFYEEEKS